MSCSILNTAKFYLEIQCICVSRSNWSPQQLRTSASGMRLPQNPKKINATTESGRKGSKHGGAAKWMKLPPPTIRVQPTRHTNTFPTIEAVERRRLQDGCSANWVKIINTLSCKWHRGAGRKMKRENPEKQRIRWHGRQAEEETKPRQQERNANHPGWRTWKMHPDHFGIHGHTGQREVSLGEMFGPDQANLKP